MAKLGTKARPAIVRVKTEQRAAEIMSICNEHGWVCIVGIEPDKREDTSDVDRLLNPIRPEIADQVTGRNEPCPCGSGKKYKHCCGKSKLQAETASPKNQDRSDFQRAVDKTLRQFKLR